MAKKEKKRQTIPTTLFQCKFCEAYGMALVMDSPTKIKCEWCPKCHGLGFIRQNG
jgi:Zn-finger nucleic acid-binding protein